MTQQIYAQLFDLLITARNSHDDEALQKAIDIVATRASHVQYNLPGSGRIILLDLSYVNESAGIYRHYAIEVVDGKMVSSGDLEPDAAAVVFFDAFKKECGREFLEIAAEEFSPPRKDPP